MDCTTGPGVLCSLGNESGRREHECATQEGDRQDRDDERPGGAHRPAKDLDPQVRKPGAVLVAAVPLGDRGEDDALVEIRRGLRSRQGAEQADQPRGAAEFRRTCRAAAEVIGEAPAVGVTQGIEQERDRKSVV
jgi:hypothetical protein